MEKLTLNVMGMSCAHCETAIKNALNKSGIANVDVDLKENKVSMEYDAAKISLQSIKDEIEEQGYDIV